MLTSSFVTLLSLAASALAITVTNPSQDVTWSTSGPNTVSWTEVSTDPTTFAVTLVQLGVFKQTLADNVDGTKGSLTISASLPVGTGFQVNIVKSSQDMNTILAQSAQFNITQGTGSSSSAANSSAGTATSSSSSAGPSLNPSTTSGGSASSLGTILPNPSSTALSPTATHSSAASLSAQHSSFLVVLAFCGLAAI